MPRYKSVHTGPQIDSGVARALDGGEIDQLRPNRNLLDNWYFANPVNQRGSKRYVGSASAGIDRWWQQYDTDITVQDGYITVSGEWQTEQRFENPIDVTDITISLLSRNCTGKFRAGLKFEDGTESGWKEIGISESAFALKTVTFKQVTKKVAAFKLSFVGNAGSIDLLAAKLELGTVQTLAHQDENGNWVPNEIPDYGEQLRKCQRYFRRIYPPEYAGFARGCAYSADEVMVLIPFETMRTSPSANFNNASGIFASNLATGDVFDVSFSAHWNVPESITFKVTKAGAFVDGMEYILRGGGNGYIDINADL